MHSITVQYLDFWTPIVIDGKAKSYGHRMMEFVDAYFPQREEAHIKTSTLRTSFIITELKERPHSVGCMATFLKVIRIASYSILGIPMLAIKGILRFYYSSIVVNKPLDPRTMPFGEPIPISAFQMKQLQLEGSESLDKEWQDSIFECECMRVMKPKGYDDEDEDTPIDDFADYFYVIHRYPHPATLFKDSDSIEIDQATYESLRMNKDTPTSQLKGLENYKIKATRSEGGKWKVTRSFVDKEKWNITKFLDPAILFKDSDSVEIEEDEEILHRLLNVNKETLTSPLKGLENYLIRIKEKGNGKCEVIRSRIDPAILFKDGDSVEINEDEEFVYRLLNVNKETLTSPLRGLENYQIGIREKGKGKCEVVRYRVEFDTPIFIPPREVVALRILDDTGISERSSDFPNSVFDTVWKWEKGPYYFFCTVTRRRLSGT